MWRGATVRIGGLDVLACLRIDKPETLCRTLDAVLMVEPGVEPLRRVGRRHLVQQHIGDLILERLGIVRPGEVPVLFSPPTPRGRQPIDDLTRRGLRTDHRVSFIVDNGLTIFVEVGNARLAEVLGDHDVAGDL